MGLVRHAKGSQGPSERAREEAVNHIHAYKKEIKTEAVSFDRRIRTKKKRSTFLPDGFFFQPDRASIRFGWNKEMSETWSVRA